MKSALFSLRLETQNFGDSSKPSLQTNIAIVNKHKKQLGKYYLEGRGEEFVCFCAVLLVFCLVLCLIWWVLGGVFCRLC
jgi:hypothetical protein